MVERQSARIPTLSIDDLFLLMWCSVYPRTAGVITEKSTFSPQLRSDLSTLLVGGGASQAPVKGIAELIGQTGCIDHLLYLTQKRHRDHTLHQLKVAVLGLFLLQCGIDEDEVLLDFVRKALAHKYSRFPLDAGELRDEDVIRCWMIASLLHDVGYPLSHLNASSQFIVDNEGASFPEFVDLIELIVHRYYNKLYFGWDSHVAALKSKCRTADDVVDTCCMSICGAFETYIAHLNRVASADISDEYRTWPFLALVSHMGSCADDRINLVFDHGLWTAANLANCLTPFYKSTMRSRITVDDLIVLEAIDAISLHNAFARTCTSQVFNTQYGLDKLDIYMSPVAALLQICDEIHEWGRTTVLEKLHVKQEVERVSLGPFEYINEEYCFSNELMITFELANSRALERTGWLSDKFCDAKRQLASIDLSALPHPKKLSLGFMHPID